MKSREAYQDVHVHVVYTVPDIIKFTYYHYTSIEYTVHVLRIYHTALHLSTMLSHPNVKGITMITVQSSTIILLRSTVDYHLIKV